MKKSVIAMISILMILIPVMAFARGGGDTSAQAGVTTLNVLYYLEATTPTGIPDADWIFNEFERRNPDVRILRENLFSEPYHDKMRAYATSGNLPDVMIAWPSGRSAYLHDEKLLKDLGPFMARDNLSQYYVPSVIDPNAQQAGYLAILPMAQNATHSFWINMEVLNACGLQPPTTYADLVAQVPVLRANGYECILMGAKDEWVVQSCLFSMLLGRFCGDGWEQRIKSGQARFTDPDFVAAFTFLRQMYTDGVLNPNVLGIDYSESPGIFAAGRHAYMIDGIWRSGAFITDPDTGIPVLSAARQRNIKITSFPDIPGVKFNNSNATILGTGYGMASTIPAGSAKEDAAWRLIKWLAGKEVQSLQLEHGAFISPARVDLDTASMPFEPIQIEMANYRWANSTVVFDGEFTIDAELNVLLTEIGMGTRTPQQAAQELQRVYESSRR